MDNTRARCYAFLISLIALTVAVPARAVEIVDYFPNLPSFSRPVDIQNAGDGSDRLFVVEQAGVIRVFEVDTLVAASKVFLDISSVVDNSGNEEGLLGLAFHPLYPDSPFVYVNYTTDAGGTRTQISRFTVTDNPDSLDRDSELSVIQIPKPQPNHNAGQLAFGPDGYLYIGTGDGGGTGDPNGNAQNRATLLGSMLRIDVDSRDPGLNYAIPPDNPLVGNMAGFREEIWAWGLRNPWRFSFDGDSLWTGDVGQGLWEEISIIRRNENLGWNIIEGSNCYPTDPCDKTGLTLPIHEYFHENGRRSVAAGYVYRGGEILALTGKLIYADTYSGEIWALSWDGTTATNELLIDTAEFVSTFGVDESGELYLASLLSGRIYRFAAGTTTAIFVTAFDGRLSRDGVTLEWDIAADEPFLGFKLERLDETTGNSRRLHNGLLTTGTRAFTDTEVDPGVSYTYSLSVAITENRSATVALVRITVPATADRLMQNQPNPFNPVTKIPYSITEAAMVEVDIYTVEGRSVRKLVNGLQVPGDHDVVWDGRDHAGTSLASGVYFYTLRVDGQLLATRRMVLLK